MTIKTLIFDLGGVIVELDFSVFFKKVIEISPLHKPHSSLLLEFWRQSDMYHQGKMTNEDFYHQACELLQICFTDQKEFFEAFNSVISHINEDILQILKRIKNTGKYTLILISNINESHWEYGKIRGWNFEELFDELILSYKVKITKPDPKIYQLALEKAHCSPEECVFIDDGLNNVRGAQELGINAIHFKSVEDLIEEFRALGIEL